MVVHFDTNTSALRARLETNASADASYNLEDWIVEIIMLDFYLSCGNTQLDLTYSFFISFHFILFWQQ